jgi:N-acetyl-anhydromuramyl-L-alanine amidase AmpD
MNKLNIDIESYKLSNNNFHQIETDKNQIVVGHTFNTGMNHYVGWVKRLNGQYKATAHFTINTDGQIYQHFNPKYFSDFIKISPSMNIISIVLVNEGWLVKDASDDTFTTMIGNFVNPSSIIERRWRGQKYWSPYSNNQMISLVNLIRYLCDEYDIYLKTVGHNTKVESILDYEGVVFRSNFSKEFTDLSPAFDFIELKNNLELKNCNYE